MLAAWLVSCLSPLPLSETLRSAAYVYNVVTLPFPSTQRPARSQISTAVSFEPASERPANSAAIAARSGEDSALSAAEPEGSLLLHSVALKCSLTARQINAHGTRLAMGAPLGNQAFAPFLNIPL